MLRREQGSTPLVGSSRTTVLDVPRKAMPMDSFLLRPPDRARACLCWCDVNPTSRRVLEQQQDCQCPRAADVTPRITAWMTWISAGQRHTHENRKPLRRSPDTAASPS